MNSNEDFNQFAELDLDSIKARLVHPTGEGWTMEQANAVEVEYRRFLYLMHKFPHEHTSPTVAVDTFWHYHILDTSKYSQDCERTLGYFLHHFPAIGVAGGDDAEANRASGDRMRQLYESTFGALYRGIDLGAKAAGKQNAFCSIHPPAAAAGADAAFCSIQPPAHQAGAAFCSIHPPKKAAFCSIHPPKAAFCSIHPPVNAPRSGNIAFCSIHPPAPRPGTTADAAFCSIHPPVNAATVNTAFCSIHPPVNVGPAAAAQAVTAA